MRKVVDITPSDERYEKMVEIAQKVIAEEGNKYIVARGDHNRKNNIEPLCVKNGISFYVAHMFKEGLIYSTKNDEETVSAAISNTISSTRIGGMCAVLTRIEKSGLNNLPLSKIDEWEPGDDKLYVVTNEMANNGSGILFCEYVLKKIWKKIGNYHLMPSSIHEFIVAPDQDGIAKKEIEMLVTEINRNFVSEEEQLINRSFYFDGKLN